MLVTVADMDIRNVLLLLCLTMHQAYSHICVFSPRQRGPLDISMPGSPTCTRHAPPCGGQPVETPSTTYTAGQVAFFRWQQNLNHYEPGYPGYMDISLAPSPTSTNFTTLALVTDSYTHQQNYQHNFTAIVRIPNITCEHCVLRARYNAHKPGETTFLQCADIKIVASRKKSTNNPLKFVSTHKIPKDKNLIPLRRLMKLKAELKRRGKLLNGMEAADVNLYGFAYNPFEPYRSHYIKVNAIGGHTEMVNSFEFGIDGPGGPNRLAPVAEARYMMDEVISVDYSQNTTTILLHTAGDRDTIAKRLYQIGTQNGSLIQEADIFPFGGGSINALSWYSSGASLAFRIQPADAEGMWNFEVGSLDFQHGYTKLSESAKPEGLYVNFQWFEKSMGSDMAFALIGNENSLVELAARIYVIDTLKPSFGEIAELDVSKYTFTSVHPIPNSGAILYAFSPGVWNASSHAWSLVAVSTVKATVEKVCDIAPAGIFQRYYGGSVNQGSSNKSNMLYHVMRMEGSEADIIVGVNPITCEMSFSEVTNLRHIHSLQRVEG